MGDLKKYCLLILGLLFFSLCAAQTVEGVPSDSVAVESEEGGEASTLVAEEAAYVPSFNYTDAPQTYEIADITVSGNCNYDKSVIISYSGLSKGQKIKVPGDQISKAVKRFWKQGLFSEDQCDQGCWSENLVRHQIEVAGQNL